MQFVLYAELGQYGSFLIFNMYSFLSWSIQMHFAFINLISAAAILVLLFQLSIIHSQVLQTFVLKCYRIFDGLSFVFCGLSI
jgi:hypothetical protein